MNKGNTKLTPEKFKSFYNRTLNSGNKDWNAYEQVMSWGKVKRIDYAPRYAVIKDSYSLMYCEELNRFDAYRRGYNHGGRENPQEMYEFLVG